METIRLLTLIALFSASCLFAEEARFTNALSPNDFTSSGLSKLSPSELEHLNALVEQFKSGALIAAKQEAAIAEARAQEAEKKAEKVKQEAQSQVAKAKDELKKVSESFFAKAKTLILPGANVEYKTVESRIVGSISGWEPNSVFALENGQVWAVADASEYVYGVYVKNPKVKLMPARFGGFKLEIENMGSMRVRLVGSTKL
jgi:hypothetical protein